MSTKRFLLGNHWITADEAARVIVALEVSRGPLTTHLDHQSYVEAFGETWIVQYQPLGVGRYTVHYATPNADGSFVRAGLLTTQPIERPFRPEQEETFSLLARAYRAWAEAA